MFSLTATGTPAQTVPTIKRRRAPLDAVTRASLGRTVMILVVVAWFLGALLLFLKLTENL